jgi:hypothetical protein
MASLLNFSSWPIFEYAFTKIVIFNMNLWTERNARKAVKHIALQRAQFGGLITVSPLFNFVHYFFNISAQVSGKNYNLN